MNRGFSLIQVMVAAGILGGLSLVVLQLAQNQNQIMSHSEAKSEELELVNQARIVLSRREACLESFQGLSPDEEVVDLLNANGEPVFSVGSVYGNRSLRINEMFLENQTVPSGGGSGEVLLNIVMERLKKDTGASDITKEIMLQVATNSDDEIVSCYDGEEFGESQLSDEGFQEMPSGLYMQWGKLEDVSLNQTYHSVIFPKPFPNEVLNIQATIHRSGTISGTVAPVVRNMSETGFEVAGDHDTQTSTGDIHWFAVGH